MKAARRRTKTWLGKVADYLEQGDFDTGYRLLAERAVPFEDLDRDTYAQMMTATVWVNVARDHAPRSDERTRFVGFAIRVLRGKVRV